MTDLNQHFDYVVVGAGPAGSVVASRLAEDRDVRVLLVEAGGRPRNFLLDMPAALPFTYQNTSVQWGYQAGPEPHLDGRTIDEKTGKVVGGSSAINAMIFNRGNPMDYDGWAALGLPDWSYAHVLPYFKKLETWEEGADDWRGGDGPLRVSRCRAPHPLFHTFIEAGMQAGFEVAADHNGYKQEGLHIAQAFVHNGIRWNAVRGYLRPALEHPNLQLLTHALVEKVVVEDGRATGIVVSGPHGRRTVRASREVVLSAGPFNSPKLLMLSGIGDADDLRGHGIDVVAHVPAVGRHLDNHPGVDVQFGTRHEDSLTSQIGLVGRGLLGARWLLTKKGLGASNLFEGGAFLRTRDDVDFPNMQYEFLPLTRQIRGNKVVPVPGFQFWMDLSRPESRGQVSLRSADPADPPSIVFNHLADPRDARDLLDGVKLAREIARQPALARVTTGELSPGADAVTDADLLAYLRRRVGTSYHPSSACRMGVGEDSVVDSEGRVHGVTGLRVVDASIMPKSVTGNLNAPIIMMAEKISDRIRGHEPLPPAPVAYHRSGTR